LKSRKREQAIADFEKARDLTDGDQKNAEINQTAKSQLQILNPRLVPATIPADQANPKIYLGFHDKDDVQMLGRIAAALRKQPNYTVGNGFTPAPDPTESDVLYYHKEDEANARKIKEIVEDTLKAARIEQPLELKLSTKPGASKRAPQGWIEVWLPPLPKPAFRPARRNSPAQYEQGEQKQLDKSAGKSPISKN